MKNRKILVFMTICLLALSMSACGGNDKKEPQKETKKTSTGKKDTEKNGTEQVITTNLWELTYNEADGWIYNAEDDLTDREDLSELYIRIPEENDESEEYLYASILVSVENPYAFRNRLVADGFDEYEYEVNHAYDLTDIGGVDCVASEEAYSSYSIVRYLGRDEAAGTSVFIEIGGECADERVETLLSGLTMNLTDIGNEDGPWYWEGEPFSTTDHQAMVGTHTLTSTWIPFEDGLRTYEIFHHAIGVYGEVAYTLEDGILKQYAYDGATLSNGKEIALDEEYTNLSLDDNGTLWLSDGGGLIAVKDGVTTASYDDAQYVAMAPSGTWGISWFIDPECKKVTLNNGILSSEPITFNEIDMINTVLVDENNIYVCGSAADESGHKIFVYDQNGNYKLTLGGTEDSRLGSITFVTETENGFIGLDGNMRAVNLWSKDGTRIGTADDADLFGTTYPWFCGASKLDDGSLLVLMTEERADRSATELLAFKLSGF